jgi:GNAT superfamily N-acetyltransferase
VNATTTSREGTPEPASFQVRSMGLADIGAAVSVIEAADAAAEAQAVHTPRPPTSPAQEEARRKAHDRFVERDGPGAWVAVAGDQGDEVVGVAESIRRQDFWGLSMLFVHPDFQSRGVGGALLRAASGYADGARVRMIQSSPDPRAMRRYALAGLSMYPAAEIGGEPDRRAIPASLGGRSGGEDDLELVADVEADLGRSRTEDVAFALEDDRHRLDVVDEGSRRGWILWHPGRLVMLGASDEATAATLLWRYLDGAEGPITAYGLTSAQNWAFSVAHAARLTLRVNGAMFVDGMALPRPWIPSGWYF